MIIRTVFKDDESSRPTPKYPKFEVGEDVFKIEEVEGESKA